MCLAIPGRVILREGAKGVIDFDGQRRPADLSLLDDVAVGEYVIVQAGFATQKVDEARALETYRLLKEQIE